MFQGHSKSVRLLLLASSGGGPKSIQDVQWLSDSRRMVVSLGRHLLVLDVDSKHQLRTLPYGFDPVGLEEHTELSPDGAWGLVAWQPAGPSILLSLFGQARLRLDDYSDCIAWFASDSSSLILRRVNGPVFAVAQLDSGKPTLRRIADDYLRRIDPGAAVHDGRLVGEADPDTGERAFDRKVTSGVGNSQAQAGSWHVDSSNGKWLLSVVRPGEEQETYTLPHLALEQRAQFELSSDGKTLWGADGKALFEVKLGRLAQGRYWSVFGSSGHVIERALGGTPRISGSSLGEQTFAGLGTQPICKIGPYHIPWAGCAQLTGASP